MGDDASETSRFVVVDKERLFMLSEKYVWPTLQCEREKVKGER